jgi:hypothetical protein
MRYAEAGTGLNCYPGKLALGQEKAICLRTEIPLNGFQPLAYASTFCHWYQIFL